MKKIEEIENIKSFWSLSGSLFYHNSDDEIKVFGKEGGIKYNDDSLYLIQNEKLTETNQGVLYTIDQNLNKQKIVQIGNSSSIIILDDNLYEYNQRIKRGSFENGVCDDKGDVIWSKVEPVVSKGWDLKLMIYSTYLDHKSFFRRDIYTGETKWNFNVIDLGKFVDHEGEHDGQVKGKIRLWKDVLIVPITHQRILGIDYNTGELLWNVLAWDRYEICYNKIILFDENEFLEINPENGDIIRSENLNHYLHHENKIDRIPEFKINDNKIYFIDYKKLKIGILDYNTLKLIDLTSLDQNKNVWQIADLEVQNKKIYISEYFEDMNKRLVVYEDNIL